MSVGIVYFIVIILANSIGSLTGMGGGVIIKPVFDAIGAHDLASISFYSSLAVCVMAFVSTLRQWKNGVKFRRNQAIITVVGSVFGGFLGNITFEALLTIFPNESSVQRIQIVITVLTLLFALLYTILKWKSFNLKSIWWYLFVGVILGFFAALLGIGGGPINVALLMLCFGLPIKTATVYSILTILFSQASKIITIGFTLGYESFDLSILLAIIPASILGGLLGARLSKVLMDKSVILAYQAVVIIVIILNISNGVLLF